MMKKMLLALSLLGVLHARPAQALPLVDLSLPDGVYDLAYLNAEHPYIHNPLSTKRGRGPFIVDQLKIEKGRFWLRSTRTPDGWAADTITEGLITTKRDQWGRRMLIGIPERTGVFAGHENNPLYTVSPKEDVTVYNFTLRYNQTKLGAMLKYRPANVAAYREGSAKFTFYKNDGPLERSKDDKVQIRRRTSKDYPLSFEMGPKHARTVYSPSRLGR